MKQMTCRALIAAALFGLVAGQAQAELSYSDTLETLFVDGGQVHLDLSAGEHDIKPSADNQIRIHWRVKDIDDKRKVKTSTKVDGKSAKVKINGPTDDFRTVIEVPANSDLVIRLSAGELFVGNIRGSKDIKLRAGELNIEVADVQDYAEVKGSLWAGDIDAGPFGSEASGLFRSIEWQGEGAHDLRFKLYAGDVQIHRAALQDD